MRIPIEMIIAKFSLQANKSCIMPIPKCFLGKGHVVATICRMNERIHVREGSHEGTS